jgi:hypothetical protein
MADDGAVRGRCTSICMPITPLSFTSAIKCSVSAVIASPTNSGRVKALHETGQFMAFYFPRDGVACRDNLETMVAMTVDDVRIDSLGDVAAAFFSNTLETKYDLDVGTSALWTARSRAVLHFA